MAIETALIHNRYQMLDLVGAGGMGKVYRAYDRLTGEQVAIKQVITGDVRSRGLRTTSEQARFRLALAQEFRTLASLRHPYIISVVDYGFDDQRQPFFTMDYLDDRRTLVEYCQAKPLSAKFEAILQVFEALRYLHHRRVIHRDLKPDNVVVTGSRVKVLDFGLALVQRHDGVEPDDEVVGTVAYMAPEILQGELASECSDLYAAGLLTYEVLAGAYPYNRDQIGGLIQSILFDPPDLRRLQNALAQGGVDAELNNHLQLVINRLLEKRPEDRYADVSEVLEALYPLIGSGSGVESSAVRESFLQTAELVGREAELAQLVAALNQTQAGQGSTWLIGGESGIGKSRLVEELRIQALVEGVLVLQGGAVAEGGSPYQVWRDVVKRLILQTPLTELEASILKPLIPDISRLVGYDVPDVPDIGAVASFNRFLVTITNLFLRQKTPLLILLEDLQWSSESVEILKKLAPQVSDLPLLLIGTFRSDERPNLPDEIPGAHLIRLERLPTAAIANLSAAMVGERARSQEVLQLLADQTEGNVLFIIEVMRALVEEMGRIEQVGTGRVPDSLFGGGVKKVIAHRLNRTPAALRPLLRTAAVVGKMIDLRVMQRLFPAEQVEEWLQVCSDASLIAVQDDQWRFTHDKIRETLLAEIEPEPWRTLHRQVAEVIISLYDSAEATPRAAAPRLAYYWQNAGDAEQEAHYRLLAGRGALDGGAFIDAARQFERLLALDTVRDPLERAAIKQQLSIAYFQTGRMNEAIDQALSAIAEISTPVPTTKIGLRLGTAHQFAQQMWHRITPFKIAEKSPQAREILLKCAECLFQISESAAYYGNQGLSGYASFRGLNLIERYGASASLAYSYAGSAWFTSTQGRWSMSKQYLRLAEGVIAQVDDPRVTAALFPLALAYIGQGMWTEASRAAQDCIDGANRTGDWRNWRQATGLQGDILYYTGRYDEMLQRYLDGYSLAERAQDISQMAIQKALRARALYTIGRYDEALRLAGEALALESPSTMTVFNAQPVYLWESVRQNRLDDVRRCADELGAALGKADLILYVALDGYAAHAFARLHLLERAQEANSADTALLAAEAAGALKLLKAYARLYPIGRARAAVYAGWHMHLSGQTTKGIQSAKAGLAQAQALAMPYEEALAYVYLGRMQPDQRADCERFARDILEWLGISAVLAALNGDTKPPSE